MTYLSSLDKVKKYIREKGLLDIGDSVLVGLSGGADSVCLLFILKALEVEYGLKISALHVHHGIRGEEAERDLSFCRSLCERLGVHFEGIRLDVPALAKQNGQSLEEAGRMARYQCFYEYMEKAGINKLAVAHHKNDQAETVLFQLFRGSRLLGLSGIKAENDRIVRPLLCLTREEITSYLEGIGEKYVSDSTNLDNDISRNLIRNQIIPMAEKLQPKVVEHIVETADFLGKVQEYLKKQVDIIYPEIVSENKNNPEQYKLSITGLKQLDSIIAEMVVYEALVRISGRKKDIVHDYVDEIMKLIDKQTGRSLALKYGVTARREYDFIVLEKGQKTEVKSTDIALCVIEIPEGVLPTLFIKNLVENSRKNYTKYFDYDKMLEYVQGEISLQFRPVSRQDFIRINPDYGEKNVFDLLKNSKVSAKQRETIQVYAVGNEVLLIPGIRGSENYRVDEGTKNILVIESEKNYG